VARLESQPPQSAAAGRPSRWWHVFGRPLDERDRARVEQSLFNDAGGNLTPYVVRVAVLTALSALIASFGLLENSSAVVIGAMLVSPLMQPIIGLAAALVSVQGRRQFVSVALIAMAVVESVALSALVALIAPLFQVVTITPEILARTSPGILDVGIAFAAGAAGAYVTVRHQAAVAFPGAAIAVALMPPLAALGILLERGNRHLAAGTLLFFATNLFGIVVASMIVLSASRLAVHRRVMWHNRLAIVLPALIALAIAYPIVKSSTTTYRTHRDEARARSLLLPPLRAQNLGIESLSIVDQDGNFVASVDVAGPAEPVGSDGLARALADGLGRPVHLILRWTRRTEFTSGATPPAD
jgi:uncharacterized hydrophobic protein (TIGR00271 family)